MKKITLILFIGIIATAGVFARNPFSMSLGAYCSYDKKDMLDFGIDYQIRKNRFLFDLSFGMDMNTDKLDIGSYFGGSVFSNERMFVGLQGGANFDFRYNSFDTYKGINPNVRISYCYTFPFNLDLRAYCDLGLMMNLNTKNNSFNYKGGIVVSYSFDIGKPQHKIKKIGFDEAYINEGQSTSYIPNDREKRYEDEIDRLKAELAEKEIVRYVAVDSDILYPNKNKSTSELVSENKERSAVRADNNSFFQGVVNTYVYDRTKIFDIFLSPFNITDVRLEEDEQIINVVLGNITAWVYDIVNSSESNKNYSHILFRPLNVGISTDAFVYTDRRLYKMRLFSIDNDKAQVAVEFIYPLDKKKTSYSSSGNINNSVSVNEDNVYLNTENLNFNYSIDGNTSFRPVRAYSDTNRTYIQFPNSFLKSSEIPVVFLRSRVDETEELVSFIQKGINFILPVVIDEMQEIVLRIEEREVVIKRDYRK